MLVPDGVVGDNTFGVFVPMLETSFDVGESTGVVDDRADFDDERFDAKDLFELALCGLNRDVFGSDGVFCCEQLKASL